MSITEVISFNALSMQYRSVACSSSAVLEASHFQPFVPPEYGLSGASATFGRYAFYCLFQIRPGSRFSKLLNLIILYYTLVIAFGSASGCSVASCTSVACVQYHFPFQMWLSFQGTLTILLGLSTYNHLHTNVFCSFLYNNANRRCHGWGRHYLFWVYRIWWSLLHGWRGETEDSHSP